MVYNTLNCHTRIPGRSQAYKSDWLKQQLTIDLLCFISCVGLEPLESFIRGVEGPHHETLGVGHLKQVCCFRIFSDVGLSSSLQLTALTVHCGVAQRLCNST